MAHNNDPVNRRIRVLFLARWYPDRYDPMPGLFIQRQAEALTQWCDVAVVYIRPVPGCPAKKEAVFDIEKEVRVLRVYYRIKGGERSVIAKAWDLLKYYRIYNEAIKSISKFQPHIIHAHILTRTALIAWKFSRIFKAPFVISEHWSRYFSANNSYKGEIRRFLTSFVAGQAAAVIAVSGTLMEAMKSQGIDKANYHVIPNIVDPSKFKPSENVPNDPLKCVIHISCFDDKSKNITGFLEVLQKTSMVRQDFRCLLVGEGPDFDRLKEYADILGLHAPLLEFTGLKTDTELITLLNHADLSVVTSNYETFGTVIIESLACGVPVLSTRVGIAPEVITEENGKMVTGFETDGFSSELSGMLDRCRSYDRKAIAGSLAGRFSSDEVGRQLKELYETILGGESG